jgi:hypothetical protein
LAAKVKEPGFFNRLVGKPKDKTPKPVVSDLETSPDELSEEEVVREKVRV